MMPSLIAFFGDKNNYNALLVISHGRKICCSLHYFEVTLLLLLLLLRVLSTGHPAENQQLLSTLSVRKSRQVY